MSNARAKQKYDVSRSIKVKIDSLVPFKDAFGFVVDFAENNPDVIMALGKILEKGNGKFTRSFGCPFPEDCDRFPCDTLGCNADECDGGFCFRRS